MKKRTSIYISTIIYMVTLSLVGIFEYWLLLKDYYLIASFIFPSIIMLICMFIVYKQKSLGKIISVFFLNSIILVLLEYVVLGLDWEIIGLCLSFLIIIYICTE